MEKNFSILPFQIPLQYNWPDYPDMTAFPSTETPNLDEHEKKVFSQFGEDGITEYIFDKIGTDTKYFVEIGTEDGSECNTRFLLEELKWDGTMIDGLNKTNDEINLKNHIVTKDNVEEVWKLYDIPKEFDYFSIDTDGVDWHILRVVLGMCAVRAFVCEYNACLGSEVDQVLDYKADRINRPMTGENGEYNIFYGASLIGYYNLARHMGYSLVYTNGINAFFVNDKYWTNEDDFPNTNNVKKLFKEFPLVKDSTENYYRYVYQHPTHKTADFNTSKLLLKVE